MSDIIESSASFESRFHLLKPEDVAATLKVSRSKAYNLLQSGQIRTVRIGRSVRVRPEDLEKFIADNISG